MSWYSKYLSVFEKPFIEAPLNVIYEIKERIKNKQAEEPLVSIVVIAYNEEKRLLSCLWSLSDTICKYPFAIIGVDNNSSDRTAEVYEAIGIPYYTEYQKSCGYARRCGLEHARGKYYICIDADTMYPPKYVETLVSELENPYIVAVSSLWSYIPDKNHSWIGLTIYELLRDTYLFFQSFKRPELSVRGLVFAYNVEYGKKVGYRVDIIRGEDGSMAYGLLKYGKIKFVRNAKARAVTGYGTLDQDGTLLDSFKNRASKSLKDYKKLFTKKLNYKDDESNLIK